MPPGKHATAAPASSVSVFAGTVSCREPPLRQTGDEYFTRSFTSLGWALSGSGGWALFTHALIGSLLFAGAVAFFIVCLARRARGWRWLSGLTAFFTFGAFFNGMSFVDYGEDFSSAIMAGCWLAAVTCLVVALVRPRRT